MKRFRIYTTLLFAGLLAYACKSKPQTPEGEAIAPSETQELHLAINDKTKSFDPRLARGLTTNNIIRMLFDGLTYVDENGKIFPGIAQNIQISPDLKTYTFTLRDSNWSNGDQLKASDFEYAWKTALNPSLHSPHVHLLFAIKGAKDLYEGKMGAQEIGIHSMDDKTLVVNLENPNSYFLQLTATPAYFPVNQKWVEAHPDFTEGENRACVGNGPFTVVAYGKDNTIELAKNDKYWGQGGVKLNKISIAQMDDQAALNSFQKGTLDWVGAPLTLLGQEGLKQLKQTGQFRSQAAAGTQFLRVNIVKSPLSNLKFRKALLTAIDSQAICDKIMQGDQKPALNFVPPGLGLQEKSSYIPHDIEGARRLFEEALTELGTTQSALSPIGIAYVINDRSQKIVEALSNNWKEAFNLEIALQGFDAPHFYERVFSQNYDLAAGSWFADYFDPMSFLAVFQHKDNGTNNTGWENKEYTHLLEQSNLEMDPTKRMNFLQQAADILMNDLPVLPLFHFSFTYAKNDLLQQAKLSPLGCIEFEEAYLLAKPPAPSSP